MVNLIGSILTREQRLSPDVSSSQIAAILDFQLYHALQPLVAVTTVAKDWLCELMPLLISDTRRKVSAVPRPTLLGLGFSAVFAKSRKFEYENICSMRLERNLVFNLIWKTFEHTRSYLEWHEEYARSKNWQTRMVLSSYMYSIELAIGANRQTLYNALQHANFWVSEAQYFKEIVIERYYKFLWKKVSQTLAVTETRVSAEDLFKNYWLAANKALDKFDSNEGVLTKYIELWLQNANINPEFDHQYGISYTMPNSRRRTLQKGAWQDNGIAEQNFSQPLEGNTEHLTTEQTHMIEQNQIQNQLKSLSDFPEIRFLMLYSGVSFILSEEERKLLTSSLKTESVKSN